MQSSQQDRTRSDIVPRSAFHLGHLPQGVKGMMICVVDPPDVRVGHHNMRQELQVHESACQALWQLQHAQKLSWKGLHPH